MKTENVLLLTEMDFGIYAVKDNQLIVAGCDADVESDNWVQVSDLTELSSSEYKELAWMLDLNYGYKLTGQFL